MKTGFEYPRQIANKLQLNDYVAMVSLAAVGAIVTYLVAGQ